MPCCASEAAGTGVVQPLAGQEGCSWARCQLGPCSTRSSHPLPWLCAALAAGASQHRFMLAGIEDTDSSTSCHIPLGSFPGAFFAKCCLQRGPEHVPAAVGDPGVPVTPWRSQWQPQDSPAKAGQGWVTSRALVASQRGRLSCHLPSSCRDPNSIPDDGRGAGVPRMNHQLP